MNTSKTSHAINQKMFTQKKLYIVLITSLIAFGGFIRLIYLGSVPGGLHSDEAYASWNAFAIFQEGIDSSGHNFPVYFEAWGHGQSAMYTYLITPFIFLNGGQMNSFIIRLPQVIVSIFTLIALYKLLQLIFSRKVAVIGLFLLDICPWHVMMSRWALDANLAPGFLIFGLYFFAKGLKNEKNFLLSALFYGLSLYTYAVIWPIVPIIVGLEVLYGIYIRRINVSIYTILSVFFLGLLALPLILFLLVNMGYINEINTPIISIYRMTSFRGSELASSLSQFIANIETTGKLLITQDIGLPYDILLPYGIFYDIGRFFIAVGIILLLFNMILKLKRKQKWEATGEVLIFIHLLAGALIGTIISVTLHKINCLYIPLVICEGYGIYNLLNYIKKKNKRLAYVVSICILLSMSISFVQFQIDYYTDYKKLVSAYFHEGIKEAVLYASKEGDYIIINDAVKYPSILNFTQTNPTEYLESLAYSENRPTPKYFSHGEDTFYFGIDENNLDKDAVYIIYYTQKNLFKADYELTKFHDWYVAIPK